MPDLLYIFGIKPERERGLKVTDTPIDNLLIFLLPREQKAHLQGM